MRGLRKKKEGIALKDASGKTLIVVVSRLKKHPLYKKRFKVSKKFMVHDERNKGKKGDYVSIEETRRISKRKCWRLLDIINK